MNISSNSPTQETNPKQIVIRVKTSRESAKRERSSKVDKSIYEFPQCPKSRLSSITNFDTFSNTKTVNSDFGGILNSQNSVRKIKGSVLLSKPPSKMTSFCQQSELNQQSSNLCNDRNIIAQPTLLLQPPNDKSTETNFFLKKTAQVSTQKKISDIFLSSLMAANSQSLVDNFTFQATPVEKNKKIRIVKQFSSTKPVSKANLENSLGVKMPLPNSRNNRLLKNCNNLSVDDALNRKTGHDKFGMPKKSLLTKNVNNMNLTLRRQRGPNSENIKWARKGMTSLVTDQINLQAKFDRYYGKIKLIDSFSDPVHETTESLLETMAGFLRKNIEQAKKMSAQICLNSNKRINKILVKNDRFKNRTFIEKVKKVIEILQLMKRSSVPLNKFYEFPNRPLAHSMTAPFLEAAKLGQTSLLKKMLARDSDLLQFSYDPLHQTALHFAVQYDQIDAAKFLISVASNVDAIDKFGRTPLYHAICNKNAILVYKLLIFNASPWARKEYNYRKLAANSPQIQNLLQKFQFLFAALKISPKALSSKIRKFFIEYKINILKGYDI